MKGHEKILNQIFICLIVVIVVLTINTIILAVKGTTTSSSTGKNNSNDTSSENSNYDVSMMQTATISEILSMFDKKETKVLYIGRSTCSACVTFLPTLQQAQADYGYKTVYLDIDTISNSTTGYDEFIKKLDKEYTMTSSSGDKTDKFGTFFGYTPAVVIIKNGKMADGVIGSVSYATLSEFLEKNGITK